MPAVQLPLEQICNAFFSELEKIREMEDSIFLRITENENLEIVKFHLVSRISFTSTFMYNVLESTMDDEIVEGVYYTEFNVDKIDSVIIPYLDFLYSEFIKMLSMESNNLLSHITSEKFASCKEVY